MKKRKRKYGLAGILMGVSVWGMVSVLTMTLLPAWETFAASKAAVGSAAEKTDALVLEAEEMVRYSELYDTEEEIPAPEPVWTDEDGVTWELSGSRLLTVPLTSRSRTLSGEVIYPGVTKQAEIPRQAVMEVDDKESGQVLEAELPLSYAEYLKERWEPDLEFTVTFHSYGADSYRFGGIQVPHQAGQPPLTECREALLEAIGLTEEDCRVEEMAWAGESYVDESGILCRDAKVTGSRRLWDCRAVYEGETALPDVIRYRLQMEYRPVKSAEETSAAAPEEASPAVPEADKGGGAGAGGGIGRFPWQQILRRGLTVSVSLVFLMFLVLGLRELRKKAAALDGDRKN